MSYNMMIGYDIHIRPFYNTSFSIASKHDFDDQLFLLATVFLFLYQLYLSQKS
jgi:hypothetical protein